MCCPRPHPPPQHTHTPRLNRPAGFWFPSCCDSSSPLLSSLSRSLWVIGVPPPQIFSPSAQLSRCCCLNLIQVLSPSARAIIKKKRKENRKQNGKRTKRGDAAASTALSATRRGEQRRPGQQERGCSFTMLRRLVLQSRRSESDGEQWGEKINVIISSPNHCQNMFPESWKGMKKKTKKTTTSRLSSPTRSFLFFFPWIFPPLRLGPTPVGSPKPGKAAAGPGKLAVRHRYTDGTLPRHCIISGASHVTPLDARVAFMGYGWKQKKTKHLLKQRHARAHTRS